MKTSPLLKLKGFIMKRKINFCFNFRRGHEYLDLVQEINIFMEDQTTKQLKEFLQEHRKQRINIVLNDIRFITEEIVQELKEVVKEFNVCFRLNWGIKNEPKDVIRSLFQKYQLKYYYNDIADEWDKFNELAAAGVCDIFVGNSLGFEIIAVHNAAKKMGVKIRVYPNVAQSAWTGAAAHTKFWIRPNDCYIYSEFVDTFEFYEIPTLGQKYTEQLYQIYKFDMDWYGDLRAIIVGLSEPIDNRLLDEHWAYSRLKCGKRCAKDGSCHICDSFLEMSQKMSEKEKAFHHFLKK